MSPPDGSLAPPRWQWRAWSDEERQRIREAYVRGGIRAAAQACPHRSPGAIVVQAVRMGLHSSRSWTAAEKQRLRELYPLMGPTQLLPLFPHRSYSALAQKAEKLGLQYDAHWWTDADRAAVTHAYASGGLKAVRALGLARSEGAVLQIADLPSARSWTATELRTLRREWQRGGPDAAQAALPHRTRFAVLGQGRRLKLHQHGTCRRWDTTDITMLRHLFPKHGTQGTAARMSWRTPRAIYHQARALGLTGPAARSTRAARLPRHIPGGIAAHQE